MLEPIFHTRKEDQSETFARFIFEPLAPSFGQSVGNALRRTLLSSLPGSAVSFVKIKGAPHLFTTIKGVKESVLDIVLNLKKLRFQIPGEGSYKVSLSKKGKGKIYGKDIEGEVKVINSDLYLGEITDDKSGIEMEAIVDTGYGYVPVEEKEREETGYISIDSSFSPITKVNLKVEEARVGRKSNYDRLILEIWTDGSISPEEALKKTSSLIAQNFSHILSGKDTLVVPGTGDAEEGKTEEISPKLYDIIIDELNLPSRVINALLRENIETVADLVKSGRDRLVGLKGVGKKSIDLIEDELKKMGIELK
ncbi:MAG: DNA-directed RNA polymerase subunit alpha [bacterium]|nr:DNA-directed RNA polymerase subunit alpha [bacterium]